MSGKLKDSHLFCSYTVPGNLSFFQCEKADLFKKIISLVIYIFRGHIRKVMKCSLKLYTVKPSYNKKPIPHEICYCRNMSFLLKLIIKSIKTN